MALLKEKPDICSICGGQMGSPPELKNTLTCTNCGIYIKSGEIFRITSTGNLIQINHSPKISINAIAWYLYQLGWSLEDIGKELGYGRPKKIKGTFERKSNIVIRRRQIDFCNNYCRTSECCSCNLYWFMVKKMVKKR